MRLRYRTLLSNTVLFSVICLSLPLTVLSTCNHLTNSPYASLEFLTKTTHGSQLKVCSSSGANSCCTRNMELKMMENAEKEFKAQLEDRIIVLRHLLSSNLERFRTYFYNSLNTCHSHLDTMFKKTYGPFYEQNSKLFEQFFSRLRTFSSDSDVDVDATVDAMFLQLYRVVFALLNPLSEIGDSQWSCMRDSMHEMLPFGDVPTKLRAHLHKSLTTWREFIVSIEKTHKILDSFMNISLSSECISSLTRMSDCSLCSTPLPVKPCQNLCLNVAKGCLSDWAEVDSQWDGVVAGLLHMSNRLKGSHNLQNAFNPLPVQISEAIMIFQEKGSSLTNKVLANCFPIGDAASPTFRHIRSKRAIVSRDKRAIWLRHVTEQAEGNWRVLNHMMNSFSDKLITMKGYFKSLPYSICSDSQTAAGKDDQCWNGVTVGEYTKQLAADGVNQQRANPEFQGGKILPYRGLFIDERLQFGMLSVRIGEFLNGRNYSGYDLEEGSAFLSDDEDFEGSGIIEDDDLSIVNLDPTEAQITEQNIATNALEHIAKSSTSANSIAFVLVLLLIRFL